MYVHIIFVWAIVILVLELNSLAVRGRDRHYLASIIFTILSVSSALAPALLLLTVLRFFPKPVITPALVSSSGQAVVVQAEVEEIIPASTVRRLLPTNRTELFYSYADKASVAIIPSDDPRVTDDDRIIGACFATQNDTGKDQPPYLIIYVWQENQAVSDQYAVIVDCLPHEVGHVIWMDTMKVAQKHAFARAVEDAADQKPGGKVEWIETYRGIMEFPGVLGNDYNDRGWGGHIELHAVLFEAPSIEAIPPKLRSFYDPYFLY